MIRFLHGGDFHLDSPFAQLPADQAIAARQEQRDLLERFSALAKEEGVDLVFLTGDLFDGARIYPETLRALRNMLEELPCQVFISPGNHDPFSQRSPYQRFAWPEHVHIFSSESVEAVELPNLGCTVYGAAFTTSHRSSKPLQGLTLQGDGLHFGCFHGDVTRGLSRYGPISPDEIRASGLHYLALGHVHQSSDLAKNGETYYAYCGCPQGRGFDETGPKGVYLGTTDGRNLSLQFCPLALRRYKILIADITDKEPEEALSSLLPGAPSPDIVRILLRGARGEDSLPLGRLRALAEPYFYSVTLKDETVPDSNIWARQTEESLLGFFVREIATRVQNVGDEERATLELALRFGLAALEGREAPE